MSEAVGRVASEAITIEQHSLYGFDVEHACLMGAYVRQSDRASIRQTFFGGHQYVILGAGDSSATDIDILVKDSSGTVVSQDIDSDPTPMVRLDLSSNESYTVQVVLSQSAVAGSFVAIAILRDHGYSIPPSNMATALARTLGAGASASAVTSLGGVRGLVFHENNEWSLVGTILKDQEQSSLSGFSFYSNPTVVLGGADNAAQDLDLLIYRAGDSTPVAKDIAPDATPVVPLWSPLASSRYSVNIVNSKSLSPTFAMFVILDQQAHP